MPNPRLSFRITPELLEQLPQDADERSQFVIEAIYQKLNPPTPQGELGDIIRRLEMVEAAIATNTRPKANHEPNRLDEAINEALQQIRPSDRRQAKRLFNRLQEFV